MMSVETFDNSKLDRQTSETRETWQCDICGVVMLDLHCKLRCVNCGFMRGCSDP